MLILFADHPEVLANEADEEAREGESCREGIHGTAIEGIHGTAMLPSTAMPESLTGNEKEEKQSDPMRTTRENSCCI